MGTQKETKFPALLRTRGLIIFGIDAKHLPEMSVLVEALEYADNLKPWEVEDQHGNLLPSIRWRSKPKRAVERESIRGISMFVIEFCPKHGELKTIEVCAYLKYLNNLAETIVANRCVLGLKEVKAEAQFKWDYGTVFAER